MSLERLTAAASAILLVLVLGSPTPAGARGTCYRYKRSERRLDHLVNRARTARGLRGLHLDRHLSRVAARHSWEMRRAGRLFHTTASQFRRRVTRWSWLGENVGVGFGVTSLHRAFMQSPLHRANVLRRGTRHLGVAVSEQGQRMWVTVIFEKRANPGTTLPMPAC